jgi:serine/threonine protein kinase
MAPMQPPDHLQRLGDFEIVRELGRGGMGVVYEARQVSLNRKVALKVLGGGLGLTDKAVRRFHREAEAAAKLHHTNIVPVYATGEQDGTHFYAMELINGPSLDLVIKQLRRETAGPPQPTQASPSESSTPGLVATGPYVESPAAGSAKGLTSSSLASGSGYFDTVARMIAEVADALEYAHQHGVIHRDIKPSNLLLSPDGRLSVNDFGLARMLEQPGMTMTGEFVGTPAYMSPEQIAAGRTPLDHRTDIYSLGATLYELLTLQPPFQGERRDQVLAQIIHKEPKRPRRLDRRVPIDLETICLKALDKDPDRRYQTAGRLAEDLRRYVSRFAISARRAGPVQRLIKWARRKPGLAAALTGVLFLTLAVGFFAHQAHLAGQQRRNEQERREQEIRYEKLQNAVEKAQLAAMSGDLEGAEEGIRQAEQLGATTGQMFMLRGQIALHRRDVNRAVEALEKAVTLTPDSVAAHALLALAYWYSFQWKSYAIHLDHAERLTPITAEDHLFKGRAQAYVDPERGLSSMDEAVRRRDSPMARLFRIEARINLALDTGNLAQAQRALDEANMAKGMLPEHPSVLLASVEAHLVAAHALAEAGQEQKRLAVLVEAENEVRSLERFPRLPQAIESRCFFLVYTGHEDAAYTIAQRSLKEDLPSLSTDWGLPWLFFRRGDAEKALEIWEQKYDARVWAHFLVRAYLLADLPNGQASALQAFKESTAEQGRDFSWDVTSLLLLGQRKQASEAARESRRRREERLGLSPPEVRYPNAKALLDYQCGDLSPVQLLEKAGSNRRQLSDAHFFIGLTNLAEGDRAGAQNHFRQAEACFHLRCFSYYWSSAFRARIETNPTWPPWIPVKP